MKEEAEYGEASEPASALVERREHVFAMLRAPAEIEGNVEVAFRTTIQGREKICEICVTVIEDNGRRTTICDRIECPKPQPRPGPRT